MRAGGAAGGADGADALASGDALAAQHIDAAEMQVGGDQALAVIDHDQPALEEHAVLRQQDDAAGRGVDGRSARRGQIDPVVGRAGHAVEDPLAAIAGGDPEIADRRGEPVAEVVAVGAAGEGGGLAAALGGDAGFQLGAGLAGNDRADRDALNVEVAPGDIERAAGLAFRAGDTQGGPGAGVAVKTDDEEAGRRGAGDGLTVQVRLRARRGAPNGEAALLIAASQSERLGGAGRGGQCDRGQPDNRPAAAQARVRD